MFIIKITSQHRNDFCADIGCEHCDHTQKLSSGYDDDNYHVNVIPSMYCGGCGKNRAGNCAPLPERVELNSAIDAAADAVDSTNNALTDDMEGYIKLAHAHAMTAYALLCHARDCRK